MDMDEYDQTATLLHETEAERALATGAELKPCACTTCKCGSATTHASGTCFHCATGLHVGGA